MKAQYNKHLVSCDEALITAGIIAYTKFNNALR